jgi:hypothetical protein
LSQPKVHINNTSCVGVLYIFCATPISMLKPIPKNHTFKIKFA